MTIYEINRDRFTLRNRQGEEMHIESHGYGFTVEVRSPAGSNKAYKTKIAIRDGKVSNLGMATPAYAASVMASQGPDTSGDELAYESARSPKHQTLYTHRLSNGESIKLVSDGNGFDVHYSANFSDGKGFDAGITSFRDGVVHPSGKTRHGAIETVSYSGEDAPAEDGEKSTEEVDDHQASLRLKALRQAEDILGPIVAEHGLEDYESKAGMFLGSGGGSYTISKVDQHLDAIIKLADWLLDREES